jgi:hypothetical protein
MYSGNSRRKILDKNFKKAFSLVELALVILIIGLALAGISSGVRLVYQFNINSARSLTSGSAVNSMGGIVAWFDAVHEQSFKEVEADDLVPISAWRDINPQKTFKFSLIQNSSSQKPIYISKSAAGIPVIEFTTKPFEIQNMATDQNLELSGNPSFTIFVVASGSNNSAAKSRIFSIGNPIYECSQFDLSYWGNGMANIRFFGGDKIFQLPAGNMLTMYRITRDALGSPNTVNGSGSMLYVNGKLVTLPNRLSSDCIPTILAAPLKINPDIPPNNVSWSFQLGEIIIFDRILKRDDVKEVEKYLSKKWSIFVN